MAEGTLVKVMLFSVLVISAFFVVVPTRNIFVSSAPEVWNDCVIQLRETHRFSSKVSSGANAAANIEALLGVGAVFMGNAIEPCGVGYQFNVSGEKYLVCEDGSVSKYEAICRDEGLKKKGETSFRIVRDSNISQLTSP